jgi:hypothetical protein
MGAGLAEPIVTLDEAQAFARIQTGEEEALVAGLIRSASALCEAFLNQVVVARPFEARLAASAEWQRLQVSPVRSIDEVIQNGPPLVSTAYSIPEPVRQGVLRLVAHLFSARDGEGGDIPVTVSALWRPYRRMRLS